MTPRHDPERIRAVQELRLVGTPAEERFDIITRMARRMLNVPVAQVTVMLEHVVWVKSSQGADVVSGPVEDSYCQYAIEDGAIYVVEDSRKDPRLENNPYREVVRAYAGQPMRSQGQHVGTVCVWDFVPRTFTADELLSLADLAKLAERELNLVRLAESQLALAELNQKLEQKALVDPLTKGWNRGAIFELCARELEGARTAKFSVGLAMIDIDHFKHINDAHGHPAGDEVLRMTAERLRAAVRPTDAVGRYGGEEFMVVMPQVSAADVIKAGDRLRQAVGHPVVWRGHSIPVSASVGVTVSNDGTHFVELLARAADEGLYRAKRLGRDRVEPRWMTTSFMRLPAADD